MFTLSKYVITIDQAFIMKLERKINYLKMNFSYRIRKMSNSKLPLGETATRGKDFVLFLSVRDCTARTGASLIPSNPKKMPDCVSPSLQRWLERQVRNHL